MNSFVLRPLPIVSAASGATGGGSPAYVDNDYAGVIWTAGLGSTASLIVDFGSDVSIDTVMLFGLAGIDIYAAEVRISIATSAQGSGFGAGQAWFGVYNPLLISDQVLPDGKGVALWVAPNTSGPPAAARFVLLEFRSLGSSAGLQVARLVAGRRLTLARNFAFGGNIGVRDFGSLDFSDRAALLRRRAPRLRTIGLSYPSIYKDEVETAIAPLLQQVGNTEPIALVTDPVAHSMRQRRCYFGPLVGDLSMVWRSAAGFEWRANLVSLF